MKSFFSNLCLAGACLALLPGAVRAADQSDKPAKEEDQSAKAMKDRAAAQRHQHPAAVAAPMVIGNGQFELFLNAATPAKPEDAADNGLNPQQQQVYERVKPMLKSELTFAGRVCKLDDAQRKVLSTAGDDAAKNIAKKFGGQQQGVRIVGGGVLIINGQVQRQAQPQSHSAREMLQDALGETIKSKVTPAAAQIYAKEIAARNESRKQMVVDTLVVMLDKRLMLSNQQRTDIAAQLAEHFDESWSGELGMLLNNPQYLPNIPDDCIVPHLRESQRTVWQALPNRNVQFGFDAFENDPLVNIGIQVPPIDE